MREFLRKYKDEHARMCRTYCFLRRRVCEIRLLDERGASLDDAEYERVRSRAFDISEANRVDFGGVIDQRSSPASRLMIRYLAAMLTSLIACPRSEHGKELFLFAIALVDCNSNTLALRAFAASLKYSTGEFQVMACQHISGLLLGFEKRYADADAYVQRALRAARHCGRVDLVKSVLSCQVMLCTTEGRRADAERYNAMLCQVSDDAPVGPWKESPAAKMERTRTELLEAINNYGEESHETSQAILELARIYAAIGSFDRAVAAIRHTIEVERRIGAFDSVRVAEKLHFLGFVLSNQGKYEEALKELDLAHETFLLMLKGQHPKFSSLLQLREECRLKLDAVSEKREVAATVANAGSPTIVSICDERD